MKEKIADRELIEVLKIDRKILGRFREIQKETIEEAKLISKKSNDKTKVLGISGSSRDEFDMAQEKSSSEEILINCLDNCKKFGAEVELIKLRDFKIERCRACYSTTNTQCHFYCSCYPKNTDRADDMTNILYDKILEADAILFATPVNNFNISTLMKIFIDRCISLDGSLSPANPKAPKDKELNIKHMKFIELTANNDVSGSGMLRRFLGKVAGIIVTGHEAGASMAISNLFLTLNNYGMIFPPFSHIYAMSSVCNSTYEDKPIVLSDCYKEEAKILAENVITTAKLSAKVKPAAWKYDSKSD